MSNFYVEVFDDPSGVEQAPAHLACSLYIRNVSGRFLKGDGVTFGICYFKMAKTIRPALNGCHAHMVSQEIGAHAYHIIGRKPKMLYHRRNLPHLYPTGATLFLTWRLFDSLPRSARPESAAVDRNVGKVFLDRDRELDRGARGPLWLKDARIARLVAEALVKGANEFRLYELLAWVVMPNHVHVVFTPFRPLPQITRWLKGSTARSANLLLDRTGMPFWQYESYDHLVRSGAELERIIGYIEWNPVSAGFAQAAEDWPWSSAGFDRSRA